METSEHYNRIRGALGPASADAIHLAGAACTNTDLFLTNGGRLAGKFIQGIQFIATLDTPLF